MRAFRNAALTSFLIAMTAGSALAHSPYVRPNVMDATGRDHVTVEASFTEDVFASEVVMRSDHWHVVGPNGDTPITAVTWGAIATVIVGVAERRGKATGEEGPASEDGTLRSTQATPGRACRTARIMTRSPILQSS